MDLILDLYMGKPCHCKDLIIMNYERDYPLEKGYTHEYYFTNKSHRIKIYKIKERI